jgi:hypothetical protein
MGITKLVELLSIEGIDSNDIISIERIPPSSTLLIDGNSYMYHLININTMISNSSISNTSNNKESFNYNDYNNTITTNINILRYIYKFDIIIYIDGKSRMKDTTIHDRRKQQEQSWYYLSNSINNSIKHFDQKQIPSPELILTQFLYTLTNLNVKIVYLDEEADSIIASICDNNNRNTTTTTGKSYIYGHDSDYIAMKNCMYIEIGSLFSTDDGNVYSRLVWRRYTTCDYIGISSYIYHHHHH